MERYEILNTLLKPADLVLETNMSILRRAGLMKTVQDGAYKAAGKVLRSNFERQNDLEVVGLENLPDEGVILASNHQSWDDAQVLASTFPKIVHFMAKSEFKDWPLMRQLIELTRSFYIDRTGADPSGLRKAEEWLAAGEAIAMFPEGTIPGEEDLPRSSIEPETALLRGHTGMVRLAMKTGAPIIPVGVSGTSAVFPPEMFPRLEVAPLPTKERITLRFGEPIRFDEYEGKLPSREEIRTRTNEVMARISDLVDHHRQWVPLVRRVPEIFDHQEGDSKRLGVLLLHGFTSHVKCVDGMVPYLERQKIPWRMPVLRGHGTVYTDLAGVTSDDWVADAEKALMELLEEVEQVVVVGLSMGGVVTLELARRHADKIAGIVTVAAALRFKDPLARLVGPLSKVVSFWPSPRAYHDKECSQQNENYPKFATDAFGSLYRFGKEMEGRLGEIRTPALVIQTRKDQVVDPEAAAVIHEKLGSEDKELVWFNRSGHEMLLDLEATEVMNVIEEFIVKRRHALRPSAEKAEA